MDVSYIPIAEARGFTTHLIKILLFSIGGNPLPLNDGQTHYFTLIVTVFVVFFKEDVPAAVMRIL